MTKIAIVGGLSAGPSAAARIRRLDEKAEIMMFEKGSNISYATCGIPYALSDTIKSKKALTIIAAETFKKGLI